MASAEESAAERKESGPQSVQCGAGGGAAAGARRPLGPNETESVSVGSGHLLASDAGDNHAVNQSVRHDRSVGHREVQRDLGRRCRSIVGERAALKDRHGTTCGTGNESLRKRNAAGLR